MKGLIGNKLGMTRIFEKDGTVIPVSVIEITENFVVQVKNLKRDGYKAIQLTTGFKKLKKINKSILGHFKKAEIPSGRGIWEFHIKENEKFYVGQVLTINIFKEVKVVDITGFSKGKGFSGTVKRWNFKTQDATHGNSLSHRVAGSIGQNQTPGKVFKGKKMAGRLGNERITVQNLKVISVDTKYNVILVKGAIPGSIGSNILIKEAIKTKL